MERVYEKLLTEHYRHMQMAFLVGPRQVGKTTSCMNFAKQIKYYNWDNQNHRQKILNGPDIIAHDLDLNRMRDKKLIVIFDEIHKYSKWKLFLKGFYDVYKMNVHIIVTGSSRLDIYKKTGDSLMGRYFLYRMHPLSVRELVSTALSDKEISNPIKISKNSFDTLFHYGGFPEPYLKKDSKFSNRWKKLKNQQLFREDLRDLTRIQELGQVEVLSELIKQQVGGLINYSNLANKINASVDSIRRWIITLQSLYYCFLIRPWTKNVMKSLLKEPKIYLWDWSLIDDLGAKRENFVASHLLKYVHWLQDRGFGDYELFFIRDKNKREVDFLVSKNNNPWFIVEVKSSKSKPLSRELIYFQKQINAPYAFQVVFDMEFIDKDCFIFKAPTIIPVQTFFSQLI